MSNTVAKLNIHLGASTGELRRDFQEAEAIVSGFGTKLAGMASTATLIGATATAGFLGWGVKLAAEAETALVSFEVMLGSVERAQTMLADLKAFSAATPFEFPELQGAAKTLLAFGIQGEQIIPTLQMLGDVSGGNAEKLSSLAVVFGQIASAGKLTGGDLLQLINVGFNPLQVIAEKTGKSVSQLRDEMSKSQITFAMVEDAFRTATSEGGLFFGMMEKQSQTITGRLSTFTDNVGSLATSMGEKLLPMLGRLLDAGSAVLEVIKDLDATTITISASVMAFGAAFLGLVLILPQVVAGFRIVISAYRALATAQAISAAFSGPKGWAILAGSALIAAGAVYGVANAFSGVEEQAGKAQVAATEATKDLGEGATQASKGLGEMSQLADQLAKRGATMAQSLRLPDEIFADTIAELKELAAAGAITEETFRRGFRKAADELNQATAKAEQALKPLNVGAVTRSTMAGFSAVLDAQNAQKELTALAAKQLEEQRKHTQQNAEAIAAFREAAKVKVVSI